MRFTAIACTFAAVAALLAGVWYSAASDVPLPAAVLQASLVEAVALHGGNGVAGTPAPTASPADVTAPIDPPSTVAAPSQVLRRALVREFAKLGDVPLAILEQELAREFANGDPLQAQAAAALASKTIAFQLEADGLQRAIDTAGNPQALRVHVKHLQDLRARSFTPQERAALFPDDDAYEELLVARLQLRHEVSPDDEEQQRRLAELEASVSPALRAVERERSGIVEQASEAISSR
ncbi:lipase secretion chaperone [Ramlibacter sp.]|uniref:lipase secretion chaperone n=1 Tax=Ramlibacter sp. TaxID=1917967 RepID=UPI002620CD4E|nr:lipase secretion chaperone [Ramlibacter sp.]MDB5956965.1 Lipase chaperone [Ramlibacter sp.]